MISWLRPVELLRPYRQPRFAREVSIYRAFCSERDLSLFAHTSARAFVVDVARTRTKSQLETITRSMRRFFLANGKPDPFDDDAGQLFLRKMRATARSCRRLHLYTNDVYHQVIDSLPDTDEGARAAAIAGLVFAGRLRGADIAALDPGHCTFTESGVVIAVANRKAPSVILRRLADTTYCAVHLLENWFRRTNFTAPAFPRLRPRTGARITCSAVNYILVSALRGVVPFPTVTAFKGAAIMLANARGACDSDISAQMNVTQQTIDAWKKRGRSRSRSVAARTVS